MRGGGTFRLFVYGTLKRGDCRYPVIAGEHFLRICHTRPMYALHHLGDYPGLVLDVATGQVVEGELYEVSADLLSRLDEVEGAPSLFRLQEIHLQGEEEPILAYFYQRSVEGFPLCEGGRWKRY